MHAFEVFPSIQDFYGFDVIVEPRSKQQNTLTLNPYTKKMNVMSATFSSHSLAQKALQTGTVQYCSENETHLTFVGIKYSKAALGLWVFESKKKINAAELIHLDFLIKVYQNCAGHINKSNTDPLTGLNNRQALGKRLNKIQKGHRREKDKLQHTTCLGMLDIDFFKRVNDDFGHLYGDEVLLLFSGLMKKCFRENDYLFRYGGEEFIVILNDCSEQQAFDVLERFRKDIEGYDFPQVGQITNSAGFVPMREGEQPNVLIDQADSALYYAKEHGRNRVVSYLNLLEKGLIEEQTVEMDTELFS